MGVAINHPGIVGVIVPFIVKLNNRAVLGNKRFTLQAQFILNSHGFRRCFTAAQNDRNMLLAQMIEHRDCLRPLLGKAVDQASIQIRNNQQ